MWGVVKASEGSVRKRIVKRGWIGINTQCSLQLISRCLDDVVRKGGCSRILEEAIARKSNVGGQKKIELGSVYGNAFNFEITASVPRRNEVVDHSSRKVT